MSELPEPHPSFPSWSRWLAPLTPAWGAVLRGRQRLYEWRVLPRTRLSRPVVSVGNLVLGGTGKTPTVAALAGAALERGRLPCLLTRGHGRRTSERVVVSTGRGNETSAVKGGDEPVLLARLVPKLLVVADARRAAAGLWAERTFSPDLFLLDDGFQHLALERDRDVVLLSADDPFGGERLPPAGLLREPLEALARATDIFVVQPENPPSPDLEPDLFARLRILAPAARVAVARRRTVGPFEPLGAPASLDRLRGRRLLGLAGVARPEGAFAAMRRLGLDIAATEILPDHHRYDPNDFDRIGRRLDQERLDGVVTTGKDGVKLTPEVGFPWWWIDVAIDADWSRVLDVLDEWEVRA